MKIGQPQLPVSTPRVHLVAHLDATESTVEPYLAHRREDFQKSVDSSNGQMDAAVKIFRGGTTARTKMIRGLAELGAHVAVPAAGYLIGGPIGLGVGLLVDAGMFVAGVTRMGLGQVFSSLNHKENLPDGDWTGAQTQTLGGAKPELGPQVADAKLGGEELGQFLTENLRAGDTNVVYLSGHGLGIHQSAGLKTSEVAGALKDAHEKTGVKPEFVVLESCLQGTLENLNAMQGHARIALVSEEVMSAVEQQQGLPLQAVLGETLAGGSSEEIARRMVADAKSNDIMTLAAVDLDKVAVLTESLKPLGETLSREVVNGKQDVVRKAVQDATKFPNMKMLPLERAMLHMSDLGQFLDNLQKSDLSAESKAAAANTRELLNATILDHTEGKGYEGASGISFQTAQGVMDQRPDKMGAYSDANMPSEWSTFLTLLNAKITPVEEKK